MLGALFAGMILALGHHMYYAKLDEQEVPPGDHDLRLFLVSKQQMTAATGTAFAFAVRSALVLPYPRHMHSCFGSGLSQVQGDC